MTEVEHFDSEDAMPEGRILGWNCCEVCGGDPCTCEAPDFSVDAMELAAPELAPVAAPADEWLARRMMGFGCSDLAPLLIALGLRSNDGVPGYIHDHSKRIRVKGHPGGVPRIFLEKAGLRAPLAAGEIAQRGLERERELLEQWRWRLRRRSYYDEAETLIDPESIIFAPDAIPRELLPLVDRHCSALLDTPDAYARDVFDRLVVVQLKTSFREKRHLPWWWRDQTMGEVGLGAAWGLVVCGDGWADPRRGLDGPIRAWLVERDETAIAQLRGACVKGRSEVENLRRAAA